MKKSEKIVKLAEFIGEGIHTGLRKFCESPASHIAWQKINEMPDNEWSYVCYEVAKEVLKMLGLKEVGK